MVKLTLSIVCVHSPLNLLRKKSVDSLVGLALVYPVPSWPFTALWVAGLSVFYWEP
ncbi:Uncharacterised protein [Vibrio cholerae]|uniref:Uncharacterized protein n=1 Tax=Vibrio cholerae TaxID=666 RepID=A0A656ARE5_VIBCL|nr:Uncharacterised protein [Vibrio cholerae]